MRLLQLAVEYLLVGAFTVARLVFVVQALAIGTAAAAGTVFTAGEWPAWLAQAALSVAALSATLLITGLLLPIARQWAEPARGAGDATPVWPLPLAVSLLLLAGLAAYAAFPLTALWNDIARWLDGAMDWDDLSRPAPNAGLVLLPILIGLLVPAIVALAALAAIALPLALLLLLPDRRPRFMALAGMSAVCQMGLALASWLATRALDGLVDAATTVMRDSGDAEVLQVAGWLRQASAGLETTALALLGPALGLVAWFAALRRGHMGSR